MKPWLDLKEEYIKPDYTISELAPNRLALSDLFRVVGEKDIYSLQDAKRLQKQQYSRSDYEGLMDVKEGYSQKQMLSILKDRCKYLLRRGSTLNNPHIPKNFIEEWERITANHAQEIRRLVVAYLSNA